MLRLLAVLGLVSVIGCGGGSSNPGPDAGPGIGGSGGGGSGSAGTGGAAGTGTGGSAGTAGTGTAGGGTGSGGTTSGWMVAFEETFETTALPAPAWATDTYPDTGFSDDGAYFRGQNVTPPRAYRASAAFGQSDWLTVES